MTAMERGPPDLSPILLPRLAGFVNFLRVRGVSVGVGAELDLGAAVTRIPILDRGAFLQACRITIAKSPWDLARLEAAFDVYWSATFVPPNPEGRFPVAGPPRPAPDGVSSGPPSGPAPLALDRNGVVQVGVYSPDAPAPGHHLSLTDRRRMVALSSGARRFRRYAATLPGRRYESARRGRVDFPATARHSLRHGGEWVAFRLHRKKRLRAELVILWDVSGSMREHDGDLFALVYSMQRVAHRSRVFGFSTDVQELTAAVRGRTYPRAAAAVARSLTSTGGGTRIGRSLDTFLARYGALLHPWTTVVVLSDGWDLGETDLLGRTLDRMHRRCHLLVWVNPYANDPAFEAATAGMREAIRHVDLFLAPSRFESPRPFRPIGARPAS